MPGFRYHFVLDIPDDVPSLISFGVSDDRYLDNSGHYIVEVFELQCRN